MDRTQKKYLKDIENAIHEIDCFFNKWPKQFNIFCEELVLRRAIERNIGIIGEAVNKLLKLDRDIKITQVRNIIATRNRVIHAYDSLKPDLIWAIVINDLPVLKSEVEAMLSE